nr:hypothetical protein RVX_3037 [Nitratidesulfovibrio sp. HK-II]
MLRHGSGLLGTAEYVGTGTARDTGTIRRPCTAARLVRGRKSLYLSPTRRTGPPPLCAGGGNPPESRRRLAAGCARHGRTASGNRGRTRPSGPHVA